MKTKRGIRRPQHEKHLIQRNVEADIWTAKRTWVETQPSTTTKKQLTQGISTKYPTSCSVQVDQKCGKERLRADTDILPGVTLYLDLDRELELDDREEERERDEAGGLALSLSSSFSPSFFTSFTSCSAFAPSLASSSLASRSYLDRSPSSSSSSSS